MRRSWAALTVGILTIVVAAISFALFKYVSERMGAGEGIVVFADFRDAMGLTEKSQVQAAGIRVGQIETKQLAANQFGQPVARISIRVDPKVKLYESAVAAKRSASLLGQFYIELDPGLPVTMVDGVEVRHRQLKNGDVIKNVIEPTTIPAIMDEVGRTLPILQDILRDVRQMTSGSIAQAADNLNKLIANNSVTLERLLNRVDNIAANIENITTKEADDITASIKNVREITESIKTLVGTSGDTVQSTGSEIKTSVQKLQRSIDTLDKSLRNVEKITGKVAEGEGTVGRLLTDDTIARNVESFTEDASTFVRGLTRLQTIVGLRSEYNFLANTFKNYVSITLAPRPDKFYLIEVVDDPRGFRREVRRIRETSQGATVSENEVTVTEQMRFTFQFGKRIGPVAGRFGIKESTGGLGLDLYLLDDRLVLSTDVFDTRSNVYPRVQGRAALAVYKRNVYLIGGADDLFNYTRSEGGAGAFFDWFFGAQIVFNDQDLKSLLLFGSGAVGAASSK